MNVSLTDELKDFVQKKVQNGQYPSERSRDRSGSHAASRPGRAPNTGAGTR